MYLVNVVSMNKVSKLSLLLSVSIQVNDSSIAHIVIYLYALFHTYNFYVLSVDSIYVNND